MDGMGLKSNEKKMVGSSYNICAIIAQYILQTPSCLWLLNAGTTIVSGLIRSWIAQDGLELSI